MKVKLILVLILSLFVTSSFAIEIKNGKLLSHKEWTTGNIKVSFNDVKPKLNLSEFNLKDWPGPFPPHTYPMDQISADGRIPDGEAIVGEEKVIMAENQVIIVNSTDFAENYQIRTVICSEFQERSGYCGISDDKLKLEGGGYAIIGRSPFLTITYKYPGSFKTGIYTYVVKEIGSEKFTQFVSVKEGKVEVTKA